MAPGMTELEGKTSSTHPLLQPFNPSFLLMTDIPGPDQENEESSASFSPQPYRPTNYSTLFASSDMSRSRTVPHSSLGNLSNEALEVSGYVGDIPNHTASPAPNIGLSSGGEKGKEIMSIFHDGHIGPEVITRTVDISQDRLFSIVEIEDTSHIKSRPFRRWVSTFHQKNLDRGDSLQSRFNRWSLGEFEEDAEHDTAPARRKSSTIHKQSMSWPSSALITAVGSRRMSASTSSPVVYSQSSRRSFLRGSNRSSSHSRSFNRVSTDDSLASMHMIDEASRGRAIKRRQIIEELVGTEESYVADLKVFVNVSHPERALVDSLTQDLDIFYLARMGSIVFSAYHSPNSTKYRSNSSPS